MAVFFSMQVKRSGLEGMTRRDMNNLLKHEYRKLGRWWHRVARPRHFSRGAFQRYGYSRRKHGYNRRKQRKHGHTRPLVFSGETEKASEQHRIVPTFKGVTIHYSGVRKLNYKPRGSQVNMRKEFETVNVREIRHMEDLMANSLQRKLDYAARTRQKIRIRS